MFRLLLSAFTAIRVVFWLPFLSIPHTVTPGVLEGYRKYCWTKLYQKINFFILSHMNNANIQGCFHTVKCSLDNKSVLSCL